VIAAYFSAGFFLEGKSQDPDPRNNDRSRKEKITPGSNDVKKNAGQT
jgi:hypothetical protein